MNPCMLKKISHSKVHFGDFKFALTFHFSETIVSSNLIGCKHTHKPVEPHTISVLHGRYFSVNLLLFCNLPVFFISLACVLPLGFGRKAFSHPLTILHSVIPRYVHYRVIHTVKWGEKYSQF